MMLRILILENQTMTRSTIIRTVGLVLLAVGVSPVVARAADCSGTSVSLTPIDDLGIGLYLGRFQGGLYPNGLNSPPLDYLNEGSQRAQQIRSLDPLGRPHRLGKIVFLSLGFSNTTQEFCSQDSFEPCEPWTFMGQAAEDSRVNHDGLVIVNGAMPSQGAGTWDSPDDLNYDRVVIDKLEPKGLSELQVRAVWLKVANRDPVTSLPKRGADAFALAMSLGDISRAVKVRFPNCLILFISSRAYAGYASTMLNPEPFAYESAFSVKWVIEAQIRQMSGGGIDPIAGDLNHSSIAPLLAWGPYLWADGLVARSDGLFWECEDFEGRDGVHPSASGEQLAGTLLLNFMLESPFSRPWFDAMPLRTRINLFESAEPQRCLGSNGTEINPLCEPFDRDADVDPND